ncbi:Excitatory amino acid transporter 1 [Holothuria leucospilota]|uniref:Amino acid transporter n=1 Tax=Holothuria leucospilota TaxID=206669 RepID=A0A9Q1C9Q0_HOLLE|nr:Excitatory amino acid transporter 1 [Holothuria leucospilota]
MHYQPLDQTRQILSKGLNMFPPNIIESCFRVYKTHQVKIGETTPPPSQENTSDFKPEPILKAEGRWEYKSNILGLVVFSVAFGVVLGRLGEEGQAMRDFVNSLFATVMVLVKGIIWLSPIGVFFLVLGRILEMDGWVEVFAQIGMYSITVIMGLVVHGSIVLPLVYLLFTRRNPYPFLKGIFPAVVTAFATSSSSATLPLTITCLETNNKVDPRVARFVLPVGATINMDGTALYEAVAAIFIAQVNDYNLGFKDILTISITATLASVGAAGVPQAGLVTLVIVLNAVGLPPEDVTLIIVIDWFLDRIRTAINVEGDSIGAGIIDHFSKDDLSKLEHVVTSADGYAMVNSEDGDPNQTGNQTAL